PWAAVSEVASFLLGLTKPGTGYTLTASSFAYAHAAPRALDTFPHDALPISFTVQPSNTVAGAAISPAVQITALDAAGNPVPSFTGSVTVALGTNPGGATLSDRTPVAEGHGDAKIFSRILLKMVPCYVASRTTHRSTPTT